ncbi:MAG: sulfotransferase [Deltaproteobacteria bacterium]|nr:sulfotransferase [Deltaproteobacteria bacterium]
MLKYLRLYATILRTFGFRLRPLVTFCLKMLHSLFSWKTRGLDQLFFPAIRRTRIDRPVFILGNPRSGTTFMHRFLLRTGGVCAFELWEMIFPAITARRMLHRVVDRLTPLSPGRYHSSDAHEAGLRDVETDDAMVFLHQVEGGFLWSYFLAWEDVWGSDLCRRYFYEQGDDALPKQDAMFRFLEGCWKRNAVYKGRPRIAAKSSLFSLRTADLVRRYPDCRIIYMVRDPLEAIPSGASLLTGVLSRSYDVFNATSQERRARWLENLYQASCRMYQAFHEAWKADRIPEKNLRIVTYPQIMQDLSGTMSTLLPFLEIDPVPGFAAELARQDEVQKKRKSPHDYDLARFGLDPDRIRRDLDYVYRDYGV